MQYNRKPLGNFLIKKDLQIRLITKIVVSVLISTIVTAAALMIVYIMKYQNIPIYEVSNMADLDKVSIHYILLPPLIVSVCVNIIIGIAVGFYASRKYAIPVYRLEKWAEQIDQGLLTSKMQFREKEEMKELCRDCNNLAEGIRQKFIFIDENIRELEKKSRPPIAVKNIRTVLSGMKLE